MHATEALRDAKAREPRWIGLAQATHDLSPVHPCSGRPIRTAPTRATTAYLATDGVAGTTRAAALAGTLLAGAAVFATGAAKTPFFAGARVLETTFLLGFKESSQHPDPIGVSWQDVDDRDCLGRWNGNSGGRSPLG